MHKFNFLPPPPSHDHVICDTHLFPACRKTWIDIECSFKLCTVCNFTSKTIGDNGNSSGGGGGIVDPKKLSADVPRLRLRGLCSGSAFDSRFTLDVGGFVGGRRAFVGYFGSRIYWEAAAAAATAVTSNWEEEEARSSGGGGRWVLVSPETNGRRLVAYHNQSSDYPLGKRLWCGRKTIAVYLCLNSVSLRLFFFFFNIFSGIL